MSKSSSKPTQIDVLIDSTYVELMLARVKYSNLKKKGEKNLDATRSEIDSLNEDLEGYIKTKNLYEKYKKSMGVEGADASDQLAAKLKSIKSGVSSIVSEVPKS